MGRGLSARRYLALVLRRGGTLGRHRHRLQPDIVGLSLGGDAYRRGHRLVGAGAGDADHGIGGLFLRFYYSHLLLEELDFWLAFGVHF